MKMASLVRYNEQKRRAIMSVLRRGRNMPNEALRDVQELVALFSHLSEKDRDYLVLDTCKEMDIYNNYDCTREEALEASIRLKRYIYDECSRRTCNKV